MHRVTTWRLLSLITLAVYAVIVVVTSLLLIKNIAITIIIVMTALLLSYLVWLIFTYTGKAKNNRKLIWLASIMFFALIIEILYLLSDKENRRAIFIILIATTTYILLFNLLRKRYWSSLRQRGELAGNTAAFKNPYLIINPKSGDGRAIKANIDKLAKKQGIRVIMTEKDKDISESALEAIESGADVIGISGGDGSIGAVAKVAMKNKLPIVVLPGGTRCHFARDLGLEPKQIADSLEGFRGIERRVDVGEINGRIFLNNASFGLYADIVNQPEYRDNKLQVSQQVLKSIATGGKDLYDIKLTHNDISIKKVVQVLVGVNKYNTINLLELGHRQKLNEGVIQVTAITKLDSQLIKQLLSVISIKRSIKQGKESGFYQWTSKTLTVNSRRKSIDVGVDGESESYRTPINIKIKPKALRIYVPAEGVKNRKANPLSRIAINKIWLSIWHESV